ncbi:MAG: tetratricopeptide (TPR) repeat protein, partial [Mariniblastus sp.]
AVGRHNLAHVDLDDAIHVDPTNFDAYLIRSRVFLSESKLDQALTDCQKAVRLDNQQPQAFAVLGEIYQQLCDYSRAIEEYSRSIELAATTEEKAQNLYHRGVVFHQNDFFDEALKDFKKSCKLRPNHAGSWIWNAITCSRIEKWSEAIAGLQQAIAVRPSALHQYQKLGKPVAEQAVNHFDRQIQRGHDDAHSFQQRGLANQFLGNVGNASRDYTTALEKSPGNIETLIRRGQVYAQAKQHAAAVKDFTAVIRADSNNHAARYSRAISRSATGQPDEARSDIIKAIKIAPQHPRYHILLAELQLKAGDLAKVIRSYDKAILQDPSDPISYRRRGATHALDRNYVAAVSDFTHSLELYPAQIEVLAQRGHAFLKADQPNAALEDFELALTHNDKLALAYSGRASVLVMQNRHEYTLMWLTKAIHRFTEPRELAEVLYARGKVFSQMGRFSPANSDFTATIDLIRSDPKYVAKVRYSRAIANLQAEKWPKAEKDFRKLNRRNPNDTSVNQALQWLADRSKPRPESLGEHKPFRRPTRPPVTRRGVRLVETANRWESSPPYDTWVVRNAEKKEYGPVHYGILKTWIQDGRIDMGMKLLRADWSKWKRAEKIFSEISPVESQPLADDFPGIDVNGNQVNSNGDA